MKEAEEERHWADECVYISEVVKVDLVIHLFLPVFVYESVEGHAVFPAGGEVGDVDIGISARQQPDDVIEWTEGTLLCRFCFKSMSRISSASQHVQLSTT